MHYCDTCRAATTHGEAVLKRIAAVCAECGTENQIPFVPLLVITGAGGCGKTTVTQALLKKPNPYFIVEADYLLHGRGGYDSWERYWNHVAIVCRTLGRNRQPLVLTGWAYPSQMEQFHSTQFFSPIHYLVLACDPETQKQRLEERAYPDTQVDGCIDETRKLSAEADERENATVLDTSHMTLEQVVAEVDSWILQRLPG